MRKYSYAVISVTKFLLNTISSLIHGYDLLLYMHNNTRSLYTYTTRVVISLDFSRILQSIISMKLLLLIHVDGTFAINYQ